MFLCLVKRHKELGVEKRLCVGCLERLVGIQDVNYCNSPHPLSLGSQEGRD